MPLIVDVTVLDNGNYNSRALVGDGGTPNPAIFMDFGSNFAPTDVLELTLKGNNFDINRARDLEIFVATELEGNFPETPFMDAVHGALVASDVDIDNGSLRVTVPVTGQQFRYIAIRQPNMRYLELAEIDAVITRNNAAPTLTLNGDAELTLELGSSFTDPGATASDVQDGDLSASVVVGGDILNTNVHGTFVITYDVADSDGNAAGQIVRTVHVKETLSFDISATTVRHASLNNLATLDNGDYSSRVLIGDGGTPNPAIFMDFGANFTATDILELTLKGNNFDINRARDLEIFVATELEGNFPETSFMDAIHGTLVASDVDVDNSTLTVTVSITGQQFRYIAIRQPNVRSLELAEIDVQLTKNAAIPTITLNGESEMTVELGDAFSDPGAMAFDAQDGDLSANVVVGGDTLDTNVHGTYVITYDVTDSDGNAAGQVIRTVHVKETLSFDTSATTVRHATINDISILNDGNYNNRVLIGNGGTPNPAIFMDFGSNFTTTDIIELTLKGNNFQVNRAHGFGNLCSF